MGTVTILEETTRNPITLIGKRAGICWGGDISVPHKNYVRGLDCIESDHGRALEYPNVEMVMEGYSARVIREWYTHIGCLPSRLQASTRYINYNDFSYVVPHTIEKNPEAKRVYDDVMAYIAKGCIQLESLGIPREDSAMALPLGMETRIVDKRNMRNLIDMSRQRMCSRAYWEYRELFDDVRKALSDYSDEWKYLVNLTMKPKCEVLGYCPEKRSCGRKPKKVEAS